MNLSTAWHNSVPLKRKKT